MPTYDEHLGKENENKQFFDEIVKLNPGSISWEIIVSFYTLLHAFEKIFTIQKYKNGKKNPLSSIEEHSEIYSRINNKISGKRKLSPHQARTKILGKLERNKVISKSSRGYYETIRTMSNDARYKSSQYFFDHYLRNDNKCPKCKSFDVEVVDSINLMLECRKCSKQFTCNINNIKTIENEMDKILLEIKSLI